MLKLTNLRNVHLNDIATNIHPNGKIRKVSNAKYGQGRAEMGTLCSLCRNINWYSLFSTTPWKWVSLCHWTSWYHFWDCASETFADKSTRGQAWGSSTRRCSRERRAGASAGIYAWGIGEAKRGGQVSQNARSSGSDGPGTHTAAWIGLKNIEMAVEKRMRLIAQSLLYKFRAHNRTTIRFSNPSAGYLEVLKSASPRNVCTPMFTAAWFAVANTGKHLSTDTRVKKMWGTHTMEYYSAFNWV